MSVPQLTTPSTETTPVETDAGTPPVATATGTEATPEITPETPRVPRTYDRVDLYTHAEIGYAALDLANGRGYDHDGAAGRIEAGAHVPLGGNDFYLEVGGAGQFGGAGRNLGAGLRSGFDYQTLAVNGRVGFRLFDDMLRINGGLEVGAAHVGGAEVEFTRNALTLPLDNWSIYAGGEVGLEVFHGVVRLAGRIGGIMGLNPDYNFVDQPEGGWPPVGLNIGMVGFGVSVDLYAAGRELGLWPSVNPAPVVDAEGSVAEAGAAEAESPVAEAGEPVAPSEEGAAPAEAGTAEVAPPAAGAGAEVVTRSVEGVTDRSGIISAAAVQVRGARSAYRSMRTAARSNPELLRASVETAVAEARHALEAYSQIVDLIAQAQRARLTMSGAEARNADRSIRAMQAQQRAAYTLARRSFTDANTMVNEFNGRVDEAHRISTEGLATPSAPPRAPRPRDHDTHEDAPTEPSDGPEAPRDPPPPAPDEDDEGDLLDALGSEDDGG